MQLKDIALKNLQRRKTRMLFLVFGTVFGIATIVTLFTLTSAMDSSIDRKVREAGIKMAIEPANDSASFSVGGIPIVSGVSYSAKDLPANTVEKVRTVPESDKIRVIAPKVMGTANINGKKILLVGVDFPSELKIKSWWGISGTRPRGDSQVLLGSRVAEKLGLATGQPVQINGRVFTVSGILAETGEDEDGIVFTGIRAAQNLLDKQGKYSFIEITIANDEALAASLKNELSQRLPGSRIRVVKEAAESRQELVDKFSRFSVVVSFVMVIIAALIISTTMMASVNERTREIGIFRAIGFRKGHIVKIILTEAGVVAGASGFIGYLLGMITAMAIAPMFADYRLVITWRPVLGILVIAGAVILGILASLYPAGRAAKLDPAEALRFI